MAEFVNWKAEMSQNKEALYLQNLRFEFFSFFIFTSMICRLKETCCTFENLLRMEGPTIDLDLQNK